MATAPIKNTATNSTPVTTRTAVTVGVILAMILLIIISAWWTGNKRPASPPSPSVVIYQRMLREQSERGIPRSMVDAIPLVKYSTVIRISRMENGTDEEASLSVHTSRHIGQDSTRDECPVCVETFLTNDDVRILPCGHIYHHRCVDRWLLRIAGTCPVCRTRVEDTLPHAKVELVRLKAARTTERRL
ncbi:hypothetical protein EDD37DRAFT_18425 [Exophiala viscosa]|uniref:RING-type domain-containing protein n=1 Tax=Exophiala viscosa TaxID=2486360 RepID=A0AAN6ICC4_9EURO|nr:hypothetical protein EDD36DRAFT_327030 [Exophiala viscosa]KAI1628740.1 hypothetical protein EDD37DRAFT_18425 [Exophiala viscosa]